jgi:nucleoid-associated protein YgaU
MTITFQSGESMHFIFRARDLCAALFITVLLAGCGTEDEKINAEVQTKVAAVAPGATATVKDGVVTLTGQVDSNSVKAQAEQAVREVKGVKNVVENLGVKPAPVAAAPEKAPAPLPEADDAKREGAVKETYYTVKNGDSLSKIAKNYPGLTWQKIYEANKDQLKNPDPIYPGQKLVIPAK